MCWDSRFFSLESSASGSLKKNGKNHRSQALDVVCLELAAFKYRRTKCLKVKALF